MGTCPCLVATARCGNNAACQPSATPLANTSRSTHWGLEPACPWPAQLSRAVMLMAPGCVAALLAQQEGGNISLAIWLPSCPGAAPGCWIGACGPAAGTRRPAHQATFVAAYCTVNAVCQAIGLLSQPTLWQAQPLLGLAGSYIACAACPLGPLGRTLFVNGRLEGSPIVP